MSELDAYQYELPRELIAQQPLDRRADARLMVLRRSSDEIEHYHVRDLPDLLSAGDSLVMNDSRVVPARLVGRRTNTGGNWEGLFLAADEQGVWKLLGKTRGKITAGETVTLLNHEVREDIQLRLLTRLGGGQWAARPLSEEDHWTILDRVGRVPLPHYIRGGEMLAADLQRYQTVFAVHRGSVAAPTAGLHFSKSLLERLRQQKIGTSFVTLHVGIDTFRPITANHLDQHVMHTEWGQIGGESVEQLNKCRSAGGRIVAVGTTSVRVLESWATGEMGHAWSGATDLFIRPPYHFRAVDALMTNFHLPRTTLLVLACCFGGAELIMRAYQEAIQQQYRFYSYGDAMLIL